MSATRSPLCERHSVLATATLLDKMVVKLSSSCCGCCSLRASTLIIGLLGTIGGAYFFFMSICGPDTEEEYFKAKEELEIHDFNHTTVVMTTPEGPGDLAEQSENSSFRTGHEGIAGIVQFVISIVLFFGAIKNNPKYVYPWIFVNVVLFAISCVLYLVLILFIFAAGSGYVGLLFTVVLLIYAGFHAYTILVVNSYYTTLTIGPISQA